MKLIFGLLLIALACIQMVNGCSPVEERRFVEGVESVLVDSPSQNNNVFDNIGIGEGYEDNSVNPSPLITPKDPA